MRLSLEPMNCSFLSSSVHVILRARIMEWVAIPFFRVSWNLPNLGTECVSLKSPALKVGSFTSSTTWEAPSPFQHLLILAPEGLFLKPNYHNPCLTESEVSVRESKT